MRTRTEAGDLQDLLHALNNRLTALLLILELAAEPETPPEDLAAAIRDALRHARALAGDIRTAVSQADRASASASLAPEPGDIDGDPRK